MFRKIFSAAQKNYLCLLRRGRWQYNQCALQNKYATAMRGGLYGRLEQKSSRKYAIRVNPLIALGLVFAACEAEEADKSLKSEDTNQSVDNPPKPDDSDVKALIIKALQASRRGEFDEADTACHDALELIKQHQDDQSWPTVKVIKATVYVYDLMANLCLNHRKLDRAKVLFIECMRGLVQTGTPQDDNSIIEISLKLAIIYAMQGKIQDAEIGYNFCIDTQSKKLKKLDEETEAERINLQALLGLCLHSYGKFLLQQKRYKDAEEKLNKCLELARVAMGNEHHQVGVVSCDLSNAIALQGRYEEALELVERAKASAQPDSYNLALFLCNEGPLKAQLKDYRKGNAACSKAMYIAKKLEMKELVDEAKDCYNRVNAIKRDK